MSKHILMVAPYFPPDGSGLENYVYQIAKRLVTQGFRLTVVTSASDNDKEEYVDGIHVKRFKAHAIISATPLVWGLEKKICRIMTEENVDIIHAHTPVPFFADIAAVVARKTQKPFIVTYHASDLMKGIVWIDAVAKIYQSAFEKSMLRTARIIVAVAENIRDNLLFQWKEKVRVITPGVDEKLFTFVPLEKRERSTIIFAGSLQKASSWKGLDVLLEAVRLIDNDESVHLRVAGDGDNRQYYETLVEKLGIVKRVTFLGQLTHERLVHEYQKARAVVLPTTGTVEGCPTVMLEAMATGAPIIGTNAGGIPSIITHQKNGFIVERGKAEDLAHHIMRLLHDDDLAETFSRQGYAKIHENHTWDVVTRHYQDLYNTL